jgi:hypothetical protein
MRRSSSQRCMKNALGRGPNQTVVSGASRCPSLVPTLKQALPSSGTPDRGQPTPCVGEVEDRDSAPTKRGARRRGQDALGKQLGASGGDVVGVDGSMQRMPSRIGDTGLHLRRD